MDDDVISPINILSVVEKPSLRSLTAADKLTSPLETAIPVPAVTVASLPAAPVSPCGP